MRAAIISDVNITNRHNNFGSITVYTSFIYFDPLFQLSMIRDKYEMEKHKDRVFCIMQIYS